MNINSVYIFRDDGIPLLTRYYGDERSIKVMDGLVTPLLVAITERLKEITGKGLKEIKLGGRFHLILESFGELICAFVVQENKVEEDLMQLVARRFYKDFQKEISTPVWDGNTNKFKSFIPLLDEILGINVEEQIEQLPKRPLDTFALTEFGGITRKIIKLLIRDGESNIELIKQELGIEEDEITDSFNELLVAGYIGKKRIANGDNIYFSM